MAERSIKDIDINYFRINFVDQAFVECTLTIGYSYPDGYSSHFTMLSSMFDYPDNQFEIDGYTFDISAYNHILTKVEELAGIPIEKLTEGKLCYL